MIPDWLITLAIIAAALFVLFAGVCLLIAWKIKAVIDRLFSVDSQVLERKFERLRTQLPDESESALIQRVISAEARNAGLVGFLTGFAGLLALPVALPIDAVTTLRIQYRLAQFIHRRCAGKIGGDEDQGYESFMLIVGAHQASEIGGRFLLKMLVQFAPKIVLESIPIVGGVVGFGVNYAATKTLGAYCLRRLSTSTAVGDTPPARS